jgi:hypothetical protein
MTDETQPFAILLEDYVLLVATQYIDQVDTERQTMLINLLLDVGQDPDLANPAVSTDTSERQSS